MSITFSGDIQLAAKLKTSAVRVDQATEELPAQLARQILRKALTITPEDTGALKESAGIAKVADGYEVQYLAPYALVVHEDLEAQHPVGEAQFLSKAVAAIRKEVTATFKKELQR